MCILYIYVHFLTLIATVYNLYLFIFYNSADLENAGIAHAKDNKY